ncbi:MAG: glycosyltransferase family 2 protein [Rickettsiales bacterium]|nr:glycosyltransferase family 2 protein [Rickettsiales bacterium]
MKKLVIQIPCFNEAASLPVTLAALPKGVSGYDAVEVLVIDDGSTDDTVAVAKAHGVAKVVSHAFNRGLASAYVTGLEEALRMGAHTIVNVDADNQYDARDIGLLTAPICEGRAYVVIGERPIHTIAHFSPVKKQIHRSGNTIIRFVSGLKVNDATSGFRALHRDIACQIMIYSSYTYTIEMLILLGSRRIPVTFVPVRVNGEMRPSRLIKSNWQYIRKSLAIIIRSFFIYRPMLMCLGLALLFMLAGAGFLLYYLLHAKAFFALVAACAFLVCGVMAVFASFLCDAMRVSRVLLEHARSRKLMQPHG